MPTGTIPILSNLDFPPVEGYAIRTFGDLIPDPARAGDWNPRLERRSLREILDPVPPAERPEILVCSSPEYLPIPPDLAAFKGLKILLITDWNVCLRFLPDLCGLFDLCFVDWEGSRLLRSAGHANVFHQPMFGHDPAVFRDLGLRRDLDLSFCGNQNSAFHPERNRLLHQVASWGAGRPIHLRQAFGKDYVEVLNRSRLVFNYAIRGEANMRLFETMACGAAPLVEEGNREVSLLLKEGVHYLGYPRKGLAGRLESLLAEPERLRAVAEAARAEAPRHTKAVQLRTLLDFASGRGPAFSDTAPRPAPRRPEPAAERAGSKAAATLRVLGCNKALDGAMRDFQAAAPEFPELGAEIVPALLLSGIEVRPDTYQGAVRAVLDRHLSDPAVPAAVRSFARMRLASMLGNKEDTVTWAEQCLRELSDPAAFPEGSRSPYACLYWPPEIGRGLNNDINRTFRADLPSGASRSLRDLLAANARHVLVSMRLAQGRPAEALAAAEALPPGNFSSFDRLGSLVAACMAAGDSARAKPLLREWFAAWPLDILTWRKIYAAMRSLGDGEGMAFMDREMPVILGLFLPPEQAHDALIRVKYQ